MLRDKFYGARADVADRFRRRNRRFTHLTTTRFGHARSGRFFNDLLMTALQGTVALKQVNAVPEFISEHLNFNVPWPLQIALDQHVVVAE